MFIIWNVNNKLSLLICKQIAGFVKECKQTAVIHNLKCKQIAGIVKNISKQLIHIHNLKWKQTAEIL